MKVAKVAVVDEEAEGVDEEEAGSAGVVEEVVVVEVVRRPATTVVSPDTLQETVRILVLKVRSARTSTRLDRSIAVALTVAAWGM